MSKEGLNLEWSARLEEIREIFEEELNKPLDDDSATRAMKGGALKLLHSRQNKERRDIDAKIASRKLTRDARRDHPITVAGVATTKGKVLENGSWQIIEKRAAAKEKAAATLQREARLDQQMVIQHLKAELAKAKSRR